MNPKEQEEVGYGDEAVSQDNKYIKSEHMDSQWAIENQTCRVGDLTEAEDIKKRWQEYTEELYKKDLHDPDNHDSVITYLKPDILKREVKWALRNITTNKASGDGGISAELFQILKDDTVKVLHSICQQIWKTQQQSQVWKRSVFIPIPKKGNAKEYSNYLTIALTHMFAN